MPRFGNFLWRSHTIYSSLYLNEFVLKFPDHKLMQYTESSTPHALPPTPVQYPMIAYDIYKYKFKEIPCFTCNLGLRIQ